MQAALVGELDVHDRLALWDTVKECWLLLQRRLICNPCGDGTPGV
jgi:hypothetical protein